MKMGIGDMIPEVCSRSLGVLVANENPEEQLAAARSLLFDTWGDLSEVGEFSADALVASLAGQDVRGFFAGSS